MLISDFSNMLSIGLAALVSMASGGTVMAMFGSTFEVIYHNVMRMCMIKFENVKQYICDIFSHSLIKTLLGHRWKMIYVLPISLLYFVESHEKLGPCYNTTRSYKFRLYICMYIPHVGIIDQNENYIAIKIPSIYHMSSHIVPFSIINSFRRIFVVISPHCRHSPDIWWVCQEIATSPLIYGSFLLPMWSSLITGCSSLIGNKFSSPSLLK